MKVSYRSLRVKYEFSLPLRSEASLNPRGASQQADLLFSSPWQTYPPHAFVAHTTPRFELASEADSEDATRALLADRNRHNTVISEISRQADESATHRDYYWVLVWCLIVWYHDSIARLMRFRI